MFFYLLTDMGDNVGLLT